MRFRFKINKILNVEKSPLTHSGSKQNVTPWKTSYFFFFFYFSLSSIFEPSEDTTLTFFEFQNIYNSEHFSIFFCLCHPKKCMWWLIDEIFWTVPTRNAPSRMRQCKSGRLAFPTMAEMIEKTRKNAFWRNFKSLGVNRGPHKVPGLDLDIFRMCFRPIALLILRFLKNRSSVWFVQKKMFSELCTVFVYFLPLLPQFNVPRSYPPIFLSNSAYEKFRLIDLTKFKLNFSLGRTVLAP